MTQNNSWHTSSGTQRSIDQSQYVFVEILFVKILEGVYSHTQNCRLTMHISFSLCCALK